MKHLRIYDPAMCCSSGVCGPNVNDKLVHFSNLLKSLDPREVNVERYNLSQQPEAYVENKCVADILQEKGVDALPLIFVDDQMVFSADYPTDVELKQLLNIEMYASANGSDCCASDDSNGCAEKSSCCS